MRHAGDQAAQCRHAFLLDQAAGGAQLPLAMGHQELLFVLADPDRRDAAHTRQAHHVTWGPGGVSLCGALPWEGRP